MTWKKPPSCHLVYNNLLENSLHVNTYLFTNSAFVLSPLQESPRHRSQNFSSSIFSCDGNLPARDAPGISSSVSFTDPIDAAIFYFSSREGTDKPRSRAIRSRFSECAAIYGMGVYFVKILLDEVAGTS